MLLKSSVNSYISDEENDDFEDVMRDFENTSANIMSPRSPPPLSPSPKPLKPEEITEPLQQPQFNKKMIVTDSENHDHKNRSILKQDNIVNSIADKFKYIKQLGKGASCRVLLCSERSTKKLFALKELPKKNKLSAMQFDREVRLLLLLTSKCDNTQHIMKYIDCYMDKHCYYIVLEYCSGPTLLERVISIKHFNERHAAKLMKCILSAVNEMHENNVVHRDLKLNNMVFDKPFDDENKESEEPKLRIIDFGDSRIIENDADYKTCIGTLNYIAPEMMRSKKKGWEIKKSDMWSIGIMSFILVTGKLPFSGRTKNETLNKIKIGKYEDSYPKDCHLTDKCKDFISKLLELDTEKRMSCNEALEHEWITNIASKEDDNKDEKEEDDEDEHCHLERLRRFGYGNKLKRILINGILCELTEEGKKLLNDALMQLETDDDKQHNDIADDLIVKCMTNEAMLNVDNNNTMMKSYNQ